MGLRVGLKITTLTVADLGWKGVHEIKKNAKSVGLLAACEPGGEQLTAQRVGVIKMFGLRGPAVALL